MTSNQRYARACTIAAVLLAAGAITLGIHRQPAPAAGLAYGTALFAACAHREYTAHRRVLLEREWARRAALGGNPPPLDPCCLWSDASDGTAHHPDRCTRDRRDEELWQIIRDAQPDDHYPKDEAA